MGIMDRAVKKAAEDRDAKHEETARRQAADRNRQTDRLAEFWGLPAVFAGTAELVRKDRRTRALGMPQGVKRETNDTYLLANEVRVAFLYEGGHLEQRLIVSCLHHGTYPGGSLYILREQADAAPEDRLIGALAHAMRPGCPTCPACEIERQNATCPTCGHDLSVPRVVR